MSIVESTPIRTCGKVSSIARLSAVCVLVMFELSV